MTYGRTTVMQDALDQLQETLDRIDASNKLIAEALDRLDDLQRIIDNILTDNETRRAIAVWKGL